MASAPVAAESLLLKHQILISNRSRHRAPNLTSLDRFVLGLTTLFVSPRRIPKLGALVKPATLFKFHKALVDRKYHLLFSCSANRRKPGPKGPSAELIAAIVEMKRRNPRFGCMRIAQQISYTFGVQIDKDVVRRVLAKHYRPESGGNGPSWLTFIGQLKDSLWSIDLFRCESILLRSHWVMLVMDVFTRRLIGFGVEPGPIDGVSLCRMFNHAVAGKPPPKHVSTDHDPLFRFHRWLANLRVLEIKEVKSVPYTPMSHPFVERLIGTIRREYLDRTFFWNAVDLASKLGDFQNLLQRASCSPLARRRHTCTACWGALTGVGEAHFLRLETPLSWPVSDASARMTYEFASDRPLKLYVCVVQRTDASVRLLVDFTVLTHALALSRACYPSGRRWRSREECSFVLPTTGLCTLCSKRQGGSP